MVGSYFIFFTQFSSSPNHFRLNPPANSSPMDSVKEESADPKKALDKCLQDNKGDRAKCQSKIDSFLSSPSPNSPPLPRKPLGALLRSGSLTDV